MLARSWLAWVILLLAGISVEAQEPAYRVEVDSRSVFSSIRESEGRPARQVSLQFQIKKTSDGSVSLDVPAEQIRVEEDGRSVEGLEILAPKVSRITAILAIDISGSMARGGKMEEARQAALTFLEKLDPRADVGLILFDHVIRVAEPPASQPSQRGPHRERLRQLIRSAQPRGGTAYLDAALAAVRMLTDVEGRRAVILLTDGVDINSRSPLEEVIRISVSAGVPFYTVGIGDPGQSRPLHAVLVLDCSGSMAGKADARDSLSKIEALKRAALRFVDLIRPNTSVTLLPFADVVEKPQAFTSNREELQGRIATLSLLGGTLLYDATLAGIETLVASEARGRKAVVVLTDGRDENPGSRHSSRDVIDRAREAKIPLFMLGFGQAFDINEPVMKQMTARTGGEYHHAGNQERLLEVFESLSIHLQDDGIDEPSLRELANQTGGNYTHVSKAGDLHRLYEQLAEELQTTYRATFLSRRPSHDGTARGIDVRIVQGGKLVSTIGSIDDVARGVIVPQMSYSVLLGMLAILGCLLGLPVWLRRFLQEPGKG